VKTYKITANAKNVNKTDNQVKMQKNVQERERNVTRPTEEKSRE